MKALYLSFMIIFVLISCTESNSITPHIVNTATLPINQSPSLSSTTIPTLTPNAPVATPTIPVANEARPVFLSWPLPAYISTTKIEQYPNSPWTWNFLGLNEGQQCPPAFADFIYPYLFPYWRDESIPIEQDIAQADPHGFEIVECYSTDSSVGANGHAATDIETPAKGKTPVYAAADGKVMLWRLSEWNSMIVLKHCLGGSWNENAQCVNGRQWYTTYMHIIPDPEFLVKNKDVAQGIQIARILNLADRTHLHFEVGLEKRSYLNFVNPWGADSTPWLGCMWLDQRLCVNPNPDFKYQVFYTTSERLFVKHANLNPIEIYDAQGIKQIRMSGDHLALLDSNHKLFIREGSFTGSGESMLGWTLLVENVLDFQITNTHIAILDHNQNLLIRENDVDSEWILQMEHVRAFSISENRVGYLTENGDLYIKEGILNAEWIFIAQYVQAFQLNDNRVVIVDVQGNMYANEGKLPAAWESLGKNAKAFQLTNTRLAMINAENILMVKEGNLKADWIAIADKVVFFQLADDRILITDENGISKLKEGNLYQDWVELFYSELKSIVLNGELPVFIR